jgi:AcrR family transcriptional regulator
MEDPVDDRTPDDPHEPAGLAFASPPTGQRLLPLIGDAPRERSDARRNRLVLLAAATRLVDHCGVASVTMEAVAREAGVGKGTVFRRFENRSGLMAALLDHVESDWQAQVMSGPPPLGPGAPPMERLLAFGRSRADANLRHSALIQAASASVWPRSYAAYSFTATHVRYLLGLLHVAGDIEVITTALLAPLDPVILHQQTGIEQMSLHRVIAGWEDVVRRVVTAAPEVT